MPLSATGTPLHTRSLSVTLAEVAAPEVAFAGYVLDLRKRGFAPVGGDLQVPAIIHHMRLAGRLDRAAARLTAIDADMPTVAFEATPATGGESCRDQIGCVAGLAGLALDQAWSPGLSAALGGTRGCSHILTLAHLIGPTARWALAEDARLHGGPPARRPGERLFRRDATVDGYEPVLGCSVSNSSQCGSISSPGLCAARAVAGRNPAGDAQDRRKGRLSSMVGRTQRSTPEQ